MFLAIAVEQHAHHSLASGWFGALPQTDTALFCRATRIFFLRIQFKHKEYQADAVEAVVDCFAGQL